MVRLMLIVSALVVLLGSLLLVHFLSEVEPADIHAYERLLLSSDPSKAVTEQPDSGFQTRQGMEKRLWLTRNQQRLQVRITADTSELRFRLFQGNTEVEEEMEHVFGLFQEKTYYELDDGRKAELTSDERLLITGEDPLDPASWIEKDSSRVKPVQIVRYLEAETATQYYHNQSVVADHVTMARFRLPGHALPEQLPAEKPLMKGVAKRVEFSLSGGNLAFKAYNLHASFYSEGELL